MLNLTDLKEEEKSYICDHLCKWPCVVEDGQVLEAMCNMCKLNDEVDMDVPEAIKHIDDLIVGEPFISVEQVKALRLAKKKLKEFMENDDERQNKTNNEG